MKIYVGEGVGFSMNDNFEMCPDKKHKMLERIMEIKKDITDSMDELNSVIIELALEHPGLSEEERIEFVEHINHAKEQQNALTDLDALYMESCLERGIINPDSFT